MQVEQPNDLGVPFLRLLIGFIGLQELVSYMLTAVLTYQGVTLPVVLPMSCLQEFQSYELYLLCICSYALISVS